MDQLAAMRMFVDVVRTENLSATARHLGLAPSSVTRQIDSLERSLGVRLLTRSTRRLSLTDAGRIYYQRARQIVADVDDANQAVTELEATPRGRLRVSVSVVFGRQTIAPLLPEFLHRYPDLKVELSLNDQLVDLIAEGVDVAIRIAAALPDSTLIARRVATVRRVICASPSYLAEHGTPGSPESLSEHQCLTFRLQSTSEMWRPGAQRWRLGSAAGTVEVPVTGRLTANNADALVAAALKGMGLVLVPSWLVEEYLRSGELVAVLSDFELNPVSESSVYLVYPSARYLSPKVKAFIGYLGEYLGEQLG